MCCRSSLRLTWPRCRSPRTGRKDRCAQERAGGAHRLLADGDRAPEERRRLGVARLVQVRGAEPVHAHARLQVVGPERLLFDREGGIWLATDGMGLHRLRRSLFTAYSVPEGLAARNAYIVTRDSTDALWVGSLLQGTSRISPDRRTIRNFTGAQGYPPQATAILQDGVGMLFATREMSMHYFSDVCDNSNYWFFTVLAWIPLYLLVYVAPYVF